jgi:hypothetical protein
MSDVEKLLRDQAQWKAFVKTPIGSAFVKFERAHAELWMLEYQEHVSNRRLREVGEQETLARKELVALLQDAVLIMAK